MTKAKEVQAKDLVPGRLYRMFHSRKGVAVVECVEPYTDGGCFIVREGELKGSKDYYGPGDEFRTVNNLATFHEVMAKK